MIKNVIPWAKYYYYSETTKHWTSENHFNNKYFNAINQNS